MRRYAFKSELARAMSGCTAIGMPACWELIYRSVPLLLARSLGSNDLIIFIETLKFVFIGRRNAEATPSNDELLVMEFLA